MSWVERRPVGTIARRTATITGLNVLSRATGFVRVVATASALGIAALGDAYQRANLVSNILFELLAGGLLFSVLVPTFVAGLDRGRRDEMRALAGVLLGRALAALSVVVVAGIALGPVLDALPHRGRGGRRRAGRRRWSWVRSSCGS